MSYWKEIVILRCCRDWPVHRDHAAGNGRCGMCRQVPHLVDEIYPEEKYAKNQSDLIQSKRVRQRKGSFPLSFILALSDLFLSR